MDRRKEHKSLNLFDKLRQQFPLKIDNDIISSFIKSRENKKSVLPLPELIKHETCINIKSNILKYLQDSDDLGDIDIDCVTDGETFEDFYETKKCSKIIIDKCNNNNKLTQRKVDKCIKDFAIFFIHLYIGGQGHVCSGFIDKHKKIITIYDGAMWLCINHKVIKFLEEHFIKFYPFYEIQVICKSHQKSYGTCSMFQPTVIFLMIIYGVDETLAILDSFNDEDRELLIDSTALKLNN